MSEFDEQVEQALAPRSLRKKRIEKFISHDLKLQDREALAQQLRERQMKRHKRSIQTEGEQAQA